MLLLLWFGIQQNSFTVLNYFVFPTALGAHLEFGPNGIRQLDLPDDPTDRKHLERYKRQIDEDELLNLSPEELCKDRVSEEYFRLTTEGDCRDVVRWVRHYSNLIVCKW